MGRCKIGPASSGLGDGLAGRDVLVPLRWVKVTLCGLVGFQRMHASPESLTGVAVMREDCNYQLGRKRGRKKGSPMGTAEKNI